MSNLHFLPLICWKIQQLAFLSALHLNQSFHTETSPNQLLVNICNNLTALFISLWKQKSEKISHVILSLPNKDSLPINYQFFYGTCALWRSQMLYYTLVLHRVYENAGNQYSCFVLSWCSIQDDLKLSRFWGGEQSLFVSCWTAKITHRWGYCFYQCRSWSQSINLSWWDIAEAKQYLFCWYISSPLSLFEDWI